MDAVVKPLSATAENAPESCLHCGLPIPPARRRAGSAYCCDGCRQVRDLIAEAGLDRYYALKGDRPTAPPSGPGAGGLAWLERELEAAPSAGTVRRLTLDVQGIHCAACVWLLQELARREQGALDLRVNPGIGQAELTWDTAAGDPAHLVREANRFGYRFGPPHRQETGGSRDLLIRLAVSVAAAMNVMIFSLSFYFGLAPRDGILYPFFGWLNLGLGTLAVAVGGWPFFRAAFRSLGRGLAHLDLPIAVGIALAYIGSVRGHLAHGPEAAYFDSLTTFIALMILGRWLQEKHLARNRNALLASDGVQGLSTRRISGGGIESISVDRVRSGDRLCIVSGDLVPVAGVLSDRRARVALDWIFGESRSRSLEGGEPVPAGAFNAGETPFEIEATEDFGSSRVSRLLSQAPERDVPRDSWWHRLATGWVLAVLGLATIGFLAWLPRGADRALLVTVSILVVTCPCALGLAVPLGRDLAHGHLRRRGVFVRQSDLLDRALRVRKILFDKTGTLTSGGLELTPDSLAALASAGPETAGILRYMTARSNHPVSRTVADALRTLEVEEIPRGVLVERAGRGLEWRGDAIHRLGRRSFALGAGPDDAATWWSIDGNPVAGLTLRECLRPDAPAEVAALADSGFEVRIASGDAPDRVEEAARRIGLPPTRARGGLTPEAKAELVQELDESGDTMMIGDGLNDAPAFDAAACSGTPAVDHAALGARADFYFLGAGIDAVRHVLGTATRLRRVVRDNLGIAVAYNALALGFCFAGLVGPLAAAILMPLSSIGVVSVTAIRLAERREWK